MQKMTRRKVIIMALMGAFLTSLFVGCRSEQVSDAKRIGFLKQAYAECFLNSDPPKKIDSINDLDCLKFFPDVFEKEVKAAFKEGKIKLFLMKENEQYFIYWNLPGRTISISLLGESKIHK
jgi:hypothetical protein